MNSNKEYIDDPLAKYVSWAEVKCFANLPDEKWLLHLPDDMVHKNPLKIEKMKDHQNVDTNLQEQAKKYEELYVCNFVGIIDKILYYIEPVDSQETWKIALSKSF